MMQKIFTSIIVFSVGLYSVGQNVESSDSLERELQEIVVTANQPATMLVGNGSCLRQRRFKFAESGHSFGCIGSVADDNG